jgi:hypothetical protein
MVRQSSALTGVDSASSNLMRLMAFSHSASHCPYQYNYDANGHLRITHAAIKNNLIPHITGVDSAPPNLMG